MKLIYVYNITFMFINIFLLDTKNGAKPKSGLGQNKASKNFDILRAQNTLSQQEIWISKENKILKTIRHYEYKEFNNLISLQSSFDTLKEIY